MSSKGRSGLAPTAESGWLKVGIVSGVLLGIIFGVLIWAAGDLPEFGSIIGMPTVLGGWIFQFVIFFVIMIVFAAALSTTRLSQYARELRTLTLIGLVYGVVIWIVLDAIILPYLAVSVGMREPVFAPFAIQTLIEDLVAGILIAVVYYGTHRWFVTDRLAE